MASILLSIHPGTGQKEGHSNWKTSAYPSNPSSSHKNGSSNTCGNRKSFRQRDKRCQRQLYNISPSKRDTPRLSDAEIAERKASGRCFNCHETGHMSQNCPKRHSVKHKGDKPPGLTAHNMELEPMFEQEVEVLDSLSLAAISIAEEDIGEPLPDILVLNQSEPIGNCMLDTMTDLLEYNASYPGDERYRRRLENLPRKYRSRFTIGRGTYPYVDYYFIMHHGTKFGARISRNLTENLRFNLPRCICARALGLRHRKFGEYICMGQVYTEALGFNLIECVNQHFPNIKPTTDSDGRVGVYFEEENPYLLIVQDDDLDCVHMLPRACLEDPDFNVAMWYHRQLQNPRTNYDKKYTEHILSYQMQHI